MALKTQRNDADVQAFLESVPQDRRRREGLMLLEMMQRVTGCEAAMWGTSIVGFGSYRYTNSSGKEAGWFLTGFSPRKQSLSLYIMPGFESYRALLQRLGKFKTGRSCLYINKMEDVDAAIVEELIRLSVEEMRQRYSCGP